MKKGANALNKLRRVVDKNERKRSKEYLYRLIRLGVNLRQDWVFHIMFGRTRSARFLCALMNAVFRNANAPTVKSVKLKNPFTFGRYYGDKDSVLDLAVEDDLGNQYDVEIQTWNHFNFRERVVYYLEKMAAEQLKKGDSYYLLHKVVGIVFVDFPIWSEQELKKIKDLKPELAEKLKETQFETIKLMSVDNGVVFSECLSLYFIRIPEAGEAFSPSLRDPKLIDWLKVFRFPESTSEEEILQIEKSTPEIKEFIEQMFEILATPRQRAYIERRRRSLLFRNTMLEENAAVKQEYAAVKQENALIKLETDVIKQENVALTNKVETFERQRQENCEKIIRSASKRYNRSISEIQGLFEGRSQETFEAAFDSLLANVDYDEFVKVVSKVR